VLVLTILAGAILTDGCGSHPKGAATARAARSAARALGNGFDPGFASRLQGALVRGRQAGKLPGVSAAVVIPGKGVWTGVSGVADLRTREPVRPQTMFEAGSITKTLIAALVLKLSERGVLRLDDPLSRWVPNFPNARRITLRMLLNHTSGTSDFVDVPGFGSAQQQDPRARWAPSRTLSYVPPPSAPPGRQWAYSSTNYILLGLVIERATHHGVARELHQRLFSRSSFPGLRLQGDEPPRPPTAVGYEDLDADPQLEATPNDPYVPSTSEATAAWTAGGLLTTAEDLARAGDAIFRGPLLSTISHREMTRWVTAGTPPQYGLGLARDELAGQEVWGHIGDITGFHAELWYLPKRGITVAALMNFQEGLASRGQHDVTEALIEALSSRASASTG
jgi:D-alanyl-D-alanine carboxypeptidase